MDQSIQTISFHQIQIFLCKMNCDTLCYFGYTLQFNNILGGVQKKKNGSIDSLVCHMMSPLPKHPTH